MIAEIIIGSVTLIVLLLFFIVYYKKHNAYLTMTENFLRSSLDNLTLKKTLEAAMKDNDTLRFSESTEFVKFLSDSREMAFSYIEDVQSRIKDLDVAMKSNDPKAASTAIKSLVDMIPKEEIPNN